MPSTERALIKTVIEEGEAHERIVDLADAENCDLIIMGRRGLRPVERMLVGTGHRARHRPFPARRAGRPEQDAGRLEDDRARNGRFEVQRCRG